MPDVLPRIGLLLPRDDAAARRALTWVQGVRTVDLVVLEDPGLLASLSPARLPAAPTPAALREHLSRGEPGARPCALAPARGGGPAGSSRGLDPGDPFAAARDLVREHVLDGALLLDDAPVEARLHARAGITIVEPWPALERGALGADRDGFAAALREAERALRALGTPRPRFVLLRTDGGAAEQARVAACAEAARDAAVSLVGPLPAAEALAERGAAWVALTRGQVDLLRAFLGSGPPTTLLLEPGQRLGCAEASREAMALALERLAAWCRLEGPLCAARAPAVSVARAPAPTVGRCPFCRRDLDESPGGEPAAPGPPVACEGCGTAHHRDCLGEHGRCTVLGCEGRRGLRLGVSVPLSGLGSESPVRHPFRALEGDAGQDALDRAPVLVRVEAPIDDGAARADRRGVALELGASAVRRGGLVEGYVTVSAPRPFRVRGGLLRVRATLTTRDLADPHAPPRVDPILGREAAIVGESPTGRLGRLHDGVASLFGATGGVAIPAGCRRWPFSFRLQPDHPATVRNRRGALEESVSTVVEVVLDTDVASAELMVE